MEAIELCLHYNPGGLSRNAFPARSLLTVQQKGVLLQCGKPLGGHQAVSSERPPDSPAERSPPPVWEAPGWTPSSFQREAS